jgi:DNA-binding NarL/FixJ family response regulator
MIRILVVDDHPALRAGLGTVLDAEPGLVYAGASAGDDESLWPALERIRPDLLLLDFHLPQDDGLQLCLRIKQRVLAPKVVLYSAHAGPDLVLGATVAGADALVSKSAPARELFDVIRGVAAGERLLPAVGPEQLERGSARVRPQDAPLLELVLAGAAPKDIAARLGLGAGELPERLRRLVADLRPELASGPA